MQNAIKQKIKSLCDRAIERARKKREKDAEYAEKYKRRTGRPGLLKAAEKVHVHPHFDPYHCKRHANFLAKTIWHKIQSGDYKPSPALTFDLDKPGGGKRRITQFTFPDAAVAAVLNRRLTRRNLQRQSGNSFAYRPDRTVFDALLKLRSAIRPQRNFVLQLDFEKYFDTIPHVYIRSLLDRRDFIQISAIEKKIVSALLSHRSADKLSYSKGPYEKRKVGTPQGSSVSLTLANLANHELDCKLEAINGQFARYADDTVIVTYTYEDAIRAYDVFNQHCASSGLKINNQKSPGICILSDRQEEFRSITDFRFLGYGFCNKGLFMHGSVERRIKQKLSRLINLYLLHYVERAPPVRISRRIGPGYDWDLLGLISEIRSILYGGLSEQQLFNFVRHGVKLSQMRGYMAFYALLDDAEALSSLDGWLLSTVKQALYKRYKVLGISKSVGAKALAQGAWYKASSHSGGKFHPDPRFPSFMRGWAAARKYYFAYGLEGVEPPKYLSYY